jgi:hypothetical protein
VKVWVLVAECLPSNQKDALSSNISTTKKEGRKARRQGGKEGEKLSFKLTFGVGNFSGN